MDPIVNPFAPGAGTRPPELAGRDELLEAARIALARIRIGRPSKSTLMVGLRGVGKTVLLDRIREDAESQGMHALAVEAPESRSLPSILAPQLRQALLRLSRREAAQHLARRGLRALAGFASALKVKYQDIEIGLDLEPEPGLADNGNLETDLQDLLQTVGEAARARTLTPGPGLAIFLTDVSAAQMLSHDSVLQGQGGRADLSPTVVDQVPERYPGACPQEVAAVERR